MALKNNSTSRKNTLDKITAALQSKTSIPFPNEEVTINLFRHEGQDIRQQFINRFTRLNGVVFTCSDREDATRQLRSLAERKQWSRLSCCTPSIFSQLKDLPCVVGEAIDDADAGITDCELLIARTGTVLLSSAQPSGRILPVRVPAHVIIAHVDQIVSGVGEAIGRITQNFKDRFPSALFFASGPSRTGDIEKTLVLGVHGPKEVFVFLIDDHVRENGLGKGIHHQ